MNNHQNSPQKIFARQFRDHQDKAEKRQKIHFAMTISVLTVVSIICGVVYNYLVASLLIFLFIPLAGFFLIVIFSKRNDRAWNNFYDELDTHREEK